MTTNGPGDSTVLILPLRGGGEDGLAEAFEEGGDAVEAVLGQASTRPSTASSLLSVVQYPGRSSICKARPVGMT